MVGTCKETSEIATRIQKQAPQSEVEGVRETYENVQAVEESMLIRRRIGQGRQLRRFQNPSLPWFPGKHHCHPAPVHIPWHSRRFLEGSSAGDVILKSSYYQLTSYCFLFDLEW